LRKNKIAVIGAGKLAYSLTQALIKSGFDVQAVISSKLNSARNLAEKFSIPTYSTSLDKIPDKVNTYFITVPDGEIKNVADKLLKLKRDFTDNFCVHFSGVENVSALSSLKNKGCIVGSLHIIRPFPSKDIVEIKNSPASIEAGNKQAEDFLNKLCKKLKLRAHPISSDEKVFQHLAAVHSSNFLVGNLYNAFSLMDSKSNLPKDILRKTTLSALNNVFELSPVKALSGPVDRGDVYAIKKHIEELDRKIKITKNHRLKLLRKNYILQSYLLLDIVKAKYGKLNKSHNEIKYFLRKLLT
jgi:predicted short-subunit dehydrogenase-like oxidoreductase (DUF2520 family)